MFGRMKSVYKEVETGKRFKHTWWQIGDFIFWQKKKDIKNGKEVHHEIR